MAFQSLILRTVAYRLSCDFLLTGVRIPVKRMPEDLVEDTQVFVYHLDGSPTGRNQELRHIVQQDY